MKAFLYILFFIFFFFGWLYFFKVCKGFGTALSKYHIEITINPEEISQNITHTQNDSVPETDEARLRRLRAIKKQLDVEKTNIVNSRTQILTELSSENCQNLIGETVLLKNSIIWDNNGKLTGLKNDTPVIIYSILNDIVQVVYEGKLIDVKITDLKF